MNEILQVRPDHGMKLFFVALPCEFQSARWSSVALSRSDKVDQQKEAESSVESKRTHHALPKVDVVMLTCSSFILLPIETKKTAVRLVPSQMAVATVVTRLSAHRVSVVSIVIFLMKAQGRTLEIPDGISSALHDLDKMHSKLCAHIRRHYHNAMVRQDIFELVV